MFDRIFKKKLIDRSENKFAKIYYSQCGEDILVNYIFSLKGIQKPTYIDIGAHHPWVINNTALFYKKGCRGINIEPNPKSISLFNDERPEDINLNIGIGKKSGKFDFYIISTSSLSTFSKEEAEKFVSHGHSIEEVKKIDITTIGEVIDKYAGRKFPDFLDLDVEGLELAILENIDYKNNYPKVICVETADYSPKGMGKKRMELMNFIESNGYYLYADTNLNSIYVKNEFWFE